MPPPLYRSRRAKELLLLGTSVPMATNHSHDMGRASKRKSKQDTQETRTSDAARFPAAARETELRSRSVTFGLPPMALTTTAILPALPRLRKATKGV